MSIQTINLGTAPSGIGGDTNREAFTKANANFAFVGGTALIETVAGGSGFVNTSGVVTLDLNEGRAFHHKMVGNITSLSFTNVPAAATNSAAWTWVLWIDSTGGYSLAGTPTVTWLDGGSFDDLDLAADATNIVQFIRVGTITYATLVYAGDIPLEPYKLCFLENATLVVLTEDEDVDVASATKHGDGVISYARNGSAITVRTTFSEGDRLSVTCGSATETTSVRIPRYVA